MSISVSSIGSMNPASHKHSADSSGRVAARGASIPPAVTVAVLLLLLIVGYSWSLHTGLYLDDHSHFERLRYTDWSFHSAVEASKLGIVGEVLDLWGRTEASLRFFRPIAFWIMKAEYTVAGWNPTVMHGFMLMWHFVAALLVYALAMRFFDHRVWATIAAAIFLIHPGNIPTVYWIACQTELLGTTFVLIALLAHAKYSGWSYGLLAPEKARRSSAAGNWGYALTAMLFYALALGCRENTVLFPVIAWFGDRFCFSARRRWIRWDYFGLAAVVIGYMVLRWYMLGGFPVPRKPYLVPVTDPEFPAFVLDKLSLYLIGLFSFIPVVPIGGRAYLSARPEYLYGGLIGILIVIAITWLAYRRLRPLLWAVIWIACTLAAVLPVFASAHHLYLPSVGASLMLAALLALLAGYRRTADRPAGALRRWTVGAMIAALGCGLGVVSWSIGFVFVRGTIVEDVVTDEVQSGRPLHEGDHLFFINMPVTAYYAVPALRETLGMDELYGHALTFSPDLLVTRTPSRIERVDEDTLRVHAPDGSPYFAGVTGNTLLQVMQLEEAVREGEPIDAGLFTVTPERMDDQGIHVLRYDFVRSLNSPDFHFFLGSPAALAYPLKDLGAPRTATDRH
jgi:hypothetical protein